MAVDVVLFDADGVIQRTRGNWREQFVSILGAEANLDAFIAELFAAERPCLSGYADFPSELGIILDRWQSPSTVEEALAIWTNIEVDNAVLDTISALRRAGMTCCLASNQQAHRARYMSDDLGYQTLFDREFYSCRVGFAKPDPAYFAHILAELDLLPEQALFIDDVEANVASARRVGIRSVHFAANAGADVLVAHLTAHGVRISSE
jgi:putative hydrolase of the HAD superfamily